MAKIRPKMTRENRAKQFAPFAALTGLEFALRRVEKITVDKIELTDERKDELDTRLRMIEKNDIISVVYYCKGEYLKVTGMVSRIDPTARILQIVNTKILFADLYEISGEKFERDIYKD